MQSSLRCAACAAPLRADAAGHGHYRMKSAAAVGAVAACSRPCGAIGLMLAAIGAPPTKRTAGDAELAANEPKAGRGGCGDEQQRDADYHQAMMWLRTIEAELQRFYDDPRAVIRSGQLKATALLVGAEFLVDSHGAIRTLKPVVDAIHALIDRIRDPSCPRYNMNSISDVVRNVVVRITQQEQDTIRELASDPSSLFSLMPADVRRTVSQFASPTNDIPSASFVLYTMSARDSRFHFGRRFIYSIDLKLGQCWVHTYVGYRVQTIRFSPIDHDIMDFVFFFEPEDVSDRGELLVYLVDEDDISHLWMISDHGATKIYQDFTPGEIIADSVNNTILFYLWPTNSHTYMSVNRLGLSEIHLDENDATKYIRRNIDRYRLDNFTFNLLPTFHGYSVFSAYEGYSVILDVLTGTVYKIEMPSDMIDMIEFSRQTDGSMIAYMGDPLHGSPDRKAISPFRVARYRRIPSKISRSDFHEIAYDSTNRIADVGSRPFVRVLESKIVIWYFLADTTARAVVIKTKHIPYADHTRAGSSVLASSSSVLASSSMPR